MPTRRLVILGLPGSVAACAFWPAHALARQATPPPMVLQAGSGATQEGGIGTFCWGGQCVDMQSTPFPDCPLTVSEGEALTLDMSALGSVSALGYSIWEAAGGTWPAEPAWSGEIALEPATSGAAETASAAPLPVDLPPGNYLIEVFAQVAGGGDTLQGFSVQVLPAGAATTEPGLVSPVATPAGCVPAAA